jgi:hypothetical protein
VSAVQFREEPPLHVEGRQALSRHKAECLFSVLPKLGDHMTLTAINASFF